jgi:hypothetical protein
VRCDSSDENRSQLTDHSYYDIYRSSDANSTPITFTSTNHFVKPSTLADDNQSLNNSGWPADLTVLPSAMQRTSLDAMPIGSRPAYMDYRQTNGERNGDDYVAVYPTFTIGCPMS